MTLGVNRDDKSYSQANCYAGGPAPAACGGGRGRLRGGHGGRGVPGGPPVQGRVRPPVPDGALRLPRASSVGRVNRADSGVKGAAWAGLSMCTGKSESCPECTRPEAL